jgi:thiol:disulfide interchange protein DsbC
MKRLESKETRGLHLIFTAFLLAATAVIALPAGTTSAQTEGLCDGVDIQLINQHSPFQITTILEKHPVQERRACLVIVEYQGRPAPLYVPAARNTVILGDYYSNKVPLGKKYIDQTQARDFEQSRDEIDSAVAFTYSPSENPSAHIYMFTDPDCPYCEKAKRPIKEFADENNVEVRVIFFPIEQLHPGARDKAVRGICSQMSYDRYLTNDYVGEPCPEGQEKITRSLSLAQRLAIGGTPTFIGPHGQRIPGFNISQLKGVI